MWSTGVGRKEGREVVRKEEGDEEERLTLLCDGNKDLTAYSSVVHSHAGPARGKPWHHALLKRREEERGEWRT